MVGANTVLIDDPSLDCRLPGLTQRSPVRVVIDSRLRTPLTQRIVVDAKRFPTWLVTLPSNDALRLAAFRDCGVEVIEVPPGSGEGVDLVAALAALGARGLTRILVEGGAMVAASLLRAHLADRVVWAHAPKLLGGDAVAAVAGFGLDHLVGAPHFVRESLEAAGEDVITIFRRV
jgi:diaminohydroxyphosphoribosylaminopyrimidine deaminase/5-amino-6-(5-phosphoribosylamino)uracil reductase